jgi:hypothetical protein
MRDFKSLTCGAILMSALAFSGAISSARASTITLDLTTAVLAGGVTLIGGGTDLKFASNEIGTATFTFASIPAHQYVIDVTGQSNQSTSFVDFTINGTQLGTNTNFGSGFNTIALASFVDPGTSDVFAITNGGTGNTETHISTITVTGDFAVTPLPGALPLFATGLAALGLFGWYRKRKAPAAIAA